jgi:polysaccharide export outer membrane protein
MKKNFWIAVLALALVGCAGRGPFGESPNIQVAQGVLPPPTHADLIGGARPYTIGPYDKLMIDVFGVPDLSQKEIQADTSGNISFPLVGTVPAGGKTPAEVAALIADGLRGKYIRDPQVTVNLKETVSQVVTVSGEVKEPGLYPVVGHMTLMRAIATAKGAGDTADTGNVVVFRTVNGQKMAALYNLTAIQRGNYDDPEIYPNDVVVLGDSQARRLFRDFLQLAPALSYAVVTLVR